MSNQHELNGNKKLRNLMGHDRKTYHAHYLCLSAENEGISCEGKVTWYDARVNHPFRSEYRLYFNSNEVMDNAKEDDLLIVAKRPDEQIFIIVVPAKSTLENQLLWLFGVDEIGFQFNFHPIEDGHDPEVDFTVRYILEELGIEIEEYDSSYLDGILEPYLVIGFPSSTAISELTHQTLKDVSPIDDPDGTILKWMEHEEKLFKRMERHMVAKSLETGFVEEASPDDQGFFQFSHSILNRRKSRVGHALENHLESIFKVHDINYSRTKVTEKNSNPGFIFPNIIKYQNSSYPESNLTMLGVKSTCKDHWRQVLSEASRIEIKHLLTLEPSISVNQTDQMKEKNLQLVLPKRDI